jgi:hypothetical protein
LRLILTMARAELLQLTVEVVLHRRPRPTRNDNDPAVLGDLDPHVLHTCLTSGPDSLGDVGLPECGGRASHCDYREVCLCEVIEGIARRAERRLVVPAVDGDGAGRALDRGGGLGQRHDRPSLQQPDQAGLVIAR